MNIIGVCHLIRKANDLQAFKKFLASYKSHPAGIDHDLILVFKGFPNTHVPAEYSALLESVSYIPLFVGDRGFDLGSYFTASKRLKHDYLCFLNSYSVILTDDWLAKMSCRIIEPQVGIVGATASYESVYSYFVDMFANPDPLALPSRYLWRRIGGRILRQNTLYRFRKIHDPFPNYHIRTNAFMISRQLMLSLKRKPFRRKWDALMFESGRNSLTKQILALGLQTLVVGRDGSAYQKENWWQSWTFRSGTQENLLIADNRTEEYLNFSEAEKELFCGRSWGKDRISLLVNGKYLESQ